MTKACPFFLRRTRLLYWQSKPCCSESQKNLHSERSAMFENEGFRVSTIALWKRPEFLSYLRNATADLHNLLSRLLLPFSTITLIFLHLQLSIHRREFLGRQAIIKVSFHLEEQRKNVSLHINASLPSNCIILFIFYFLRSPSNSNCLSKFYTMARSGRNQNNGGSARWTSVMQCRQEGFLYM